MRAAGRGGRAPWEPVSEPSNARPFAATTGVLYREDNYILMTTADKERYKCVLPLTAGGAEVSGSARTRGGRPRRLEVTYPNGLF